MPGHRKRRQFKQTDAFTRGKVIGLERAGWSIRQIAADTHLGASTVHRLWRRWLEQGNVAIYRNVGATRVTSARVDRRILRQAVAAPQATCTAILQHVQDTLDHSISTRTIFCRLVANGLHSCRPLRRLPLTPPNRRQRLEWCRGRSTWMTEWHRVVFSDESHFCLSSDSRRVRVWRRRGERSNPAAIVERPTVRQRGIMVWGAIAYDSRSPLLRIQGTMTAQRYVDDVLRPVTLPYLQGVPNALYQQDNTRPHTARISQQALQYVQMLPWPPYSPDLSPIEHVWDIIGRRLHALPQPRSEDELWQMVEREWRAIPQDAIRTLIDSLPRRVAACIAVHGENRTSTTLQNRTTSPALERAIVTLAHQDNVLQPTNKLSFISPLQPHHMVESSVGPAPQAANINIGYGETPPCFNPEEEDIEDHVEEFKTWLTASKVPKGDWTKALVRRLPLDGREFIKCRFDPSAALEDVLEALKLCYPRNDGRARSRGNELKKTRRPQSTEDTGRYLMNLITAHATAGEFSPFDSSKEALWALAPKDCLLLAASWSTTRNPEEADFLQAAKFLDQADKWNKERTEAGTTTSWETTTRTAEEWEQKQGRNPRTETPMEKARRFMLPDGTPRCFTCYQTGHKHWDCPKRRPRGANVSCIDEGIANALGCARMPSKLLIRGISGSVVSNTCTYLEVNIDGFDICGRFTIIPGNGEKIIFGVDILTNYHCKIMFRDESVELYRPKIGRDDHVVELNEERELERLGTITNDRKNPKQKYCILDDLEIAPRCKTRVKLKGPTVMAGILEPHPDCVRRTGLLIPSVHVSETVSEIFIDVINTRNEPVRLVANSCLLRSGGEIANVSFLSEQVGYSTTATCKYEPQKFDINPELSDSEKIDVLDVLYRYRELFSEEWNKAADIEPYHIKLKANTEPIRQKAYRRSPKERDIIEEQVKEMCEKGVIRKSTSPWASPVVLVKKSDGSYRFCVDYRKVNNVTEKFSYPLPDITDCLDRLAGMKYFSHTDFVSGYWQCPLDETSKPITAFTTGNGLYEFQVLPFGLTGAPGHFERIMDTLLAELKWSECMVYLDDVIVYGRDIREHNVRLTNVLECFRGAGLSLKPSKCRFAYQKLPILGHVVSENGVEPATDKIEAVKEFPIPKNVKQVCSFLGLCGYYRRFIKNFSKISKPLTCLTEKDKKFVIGPAEIEAFETLKKKLTEEPILAHFNPDARIEIHTDASIVGLGAVLMQPDNDGFLHPIHYLSRTTSKHESKYGISELECLAIVWALQKLRPYIFGREFKVVTDHSALTWLANVRDPCSRLTRWGLKLMEHDFEIVHRAGRKNVAPDALSRNPFHKNDTNVEDNFNDLTACTVRIDENGQKEDTFCRDITGKLPDAKTRDEYKKINGILYKKNHATQGNQWLVVAPKQSVSEIMKTAHDIPEAGHMGVAKTVHCIKQRFYWKGLEEDVRKYVRSCKVCQAFKPQRFKPAAPLEPLPPATDIWERVGIDHQGPFKKSVEGYEHILTIVDHFSKYALAIPVKDTKAETTCNALSDNLLYVFGTPKCIISDQGKSFDSSTFRDFTRLYGIKHIMASAAHPQTNGLCEKLNGIIKNGIRVYLEDDHAEWPRFVKTATFAYNSSIQSSTQVTPHKLIFGVEPRTSLEVGLPTVDEPVKTYDEYVTNRILENERLKKIADENY
ncbi:hypothetical protein LAZ67_6002959 [Cordylochernes scorpioides]|uniref:RNA-directed DNA polymerase n=1 Tax=Cordylochernes scorpioides TaxID=51811 RepID=A0ABY6KM25_9ARAC|nr:hypothetical protein LAZ67_6002959 [Cordylochernes scorpioides]